ncbi:hypothetical protein OE88DRAFT_1662052 [Heliocybe sulcata]|uniref:Uncharacterized protein n=1 Tax=Heliocybe sulcata TaxID=5364 RepID=A0A5C3MVM0_9AGAM|nr:hypothetical protein OE88DRAFT_1662052 [Heliocybe sulcata]
MDLHALFILRGVQVGGKSSLQVPVITGISEYITLLRCAAAVDHCDICGRYLRTSERKCGL